MFCSMGKILVFNTVIERKISFTVEIGIYPVVYRKISEAFCSIQEDLKGFL